METLVGQGLFEWGTADGDRDRARLQHPLGVAALADGAIAVADTFNSLLRIWEQGSLRTLRLSEPVDEPGGLDVLPDGRLVVADTNHHRVITVDIATGAVVEIPVGAGRTVEQPDAATRSRDAPARRSQLTADVDLGGADLDLAQGPPVHVNVSADPPTLLGAGPAVLGARRAARRSSRCGWAAGAAACSSSTSSRRRARATSARSLGATREHPLTVA